jgi:hypothetical protein
MKALVVRWSERYSVGYSHVILVVRMHGYCLIGAVCLDNCSTMYGLPCHQNVTCVLEDSTTQFSGGGVTMQAL